MKKLEFEKEVSLKPLNENLYNEFSLEKLEERLETDPLMIANFLAPCNVLTECETAEGCKGYRSCYIDGDCGEYVTCRTHG